jgi:hypothetical protein
MFILGVLLLVNLVAMILFSLKALWDDRDYDKDNNGDFE